jgi:hypothetical protein
MPNSLAAGRLLPIWRRFYVVAALSGGVGVLTAAAPVGCVGVLATAAPRGGVGAAGVAPAPRGNDHHQAQAAWRNAQQYMAAAAIWGNPTTTIPTNADAEQICWGRGVNLCGMVSNLNILLEHTQSMINSTINTGVRSRNSVDSPETKLMNKLGMLTSCLDGLNKVCIMQVKQGVSTVAINNAIAKLKSEL